MRSAAGRDCARSQGVIVKDDNSVMNASVQRMAQREGVFILHDPALSGSR
jgi:hypothetical protein